MPGLRGWRCALARFDGCACLAHYRLGVPRQPIGVRRHGDIGKVERQRAPDPPLSGEGLVPRCCHAAGCRRSGGEALLQTGDSGAEVWKLGVVVWWGMSLRDLRNNACVRACGASLVCIRLRALFSCLPSVSLHLIGKWQCLARCVFQPGRTDRTFLYFEVNNGHASDRLTPRPPAHFNQQRDFDQRKQRELLSRCPRPSLCSPCFSPIIQSRRRTDKAAGDTPAAPSRSPPWMWRGAETRSRPRLSCGPCGRTFTDTAPVPALLPDPRRENPAVVPLPRVRLLELRGLFVALRESRLMTGPRRTFGCRLGALPRVALADPSGEVSSSVSSWGGCRLGEMGEV